MIRQSASSAFSLACLASFAFAVASLTGCSLNLGADTAGDKGKVRFEYSDTNNCLLGCGLDRSALQGSQVTISATGTDADVRLTARLSDASVGRITTQTDSCSCNVGNGNQARNVDRTEQCSAGETKSCSLSIAIETNQPGDAKLEMYDNADNVFDSVTMHVRPADHIDVDIREGANAIDTDEYQVKEGYKVKLGSRVFDANGGEMIFAKHGVSFDYADQNLVKPDSSVLIGSTDVEDMIAGSRTGETSVTVKAPGASKLVRFRVVP